MKPTTIGVAAVRVSVVDDLIQAACQPEAAVGEHLTADDGRAAEQRALASRGTREGESAASPLGVAPTARGHARTGQIGLAAKPLILERRNAPTAGSRDYGGDPAESVVANRGSLAGGEGRVGLH